MPSRARARNLAALILSRNADTSKHGFIMPDWPNHLTETERAALAEIDQRLAADTAERRRLMNLAKQRKHRKFGA
jgi:hypothetical protein